MTWLQHVIYILLSTNLFTFCFNLKILIYLFVILLKPIGFSELFSKFKRLWQHF